MVLVVVILFFGYSLFVILQQKRLSEIQKDFINNMTHEFKTPISTIAISADVLKNPDIVKQPERLLRYATIIQNESHRLKNQVERVLQMAVADKREIKLKLEIVDIHQIIEKSVQSIQTILDTRKGKIHYSFKALRSELIGDTLHLTNIIYNLLDNAIKYCDRQPEIYVTTLSVRNGVLIQIKDNGIGISPEAQSLIFEKFYRVPTGNLHNVKGFGLGLNYVKVLVKAHKGYIKLNSKVNEGSIFSIFLPYGEVEHEKEKQVLNTRE
jgi:two-component system phosphate regulon sensor histidine kinase PhoR